MDGDLPDGVKLLPLPPHEDPRGALTELYRASEFPTVFRQFNLVRSEANVLRGVHVHPQHSDFLVVLTGQLVLGLVDLRRRSPSFRFSCTLTLTETAQTGCLIPPGVAHGFLFKAKATYIYGLSHEWAPEGDFACRYDDPDLAIKWPLTGQPVLSERDANAMGYQDFIEAYENSDLIETER